jgi:hypothetical protein
VPARRVAHEDHPQRFPVAQTKFPVQGRNSLFAFKNLCSIEQGISTKTLDGFWRRAQFASDCVIPETAQVGFLRKWRRLRCKAVVSSPEEAGEELFTFLQFPKLQWKALRTTNALERINEEFRRRTKDRLLCPVRMPSCYYSLASCAAARSCFVAWMAGRTYPT